MTARTWTLPAREERVLHYQVHTVLIFMTAPKMRSGKNLVTVPSESHCSTVVRN